MHICGSCFDCFDGCGKTRPLVQAQAKDMLCGECFCPFGIHCLTGPSPPWLLLRITSLVSESASSGFQQRLKTSILPEIFRALDARLAWVRHPASWNGETTRVLDISSESVIVGLFHTNRGTQSHTFSCNIYSLCGFCSCGFVHQSITVSSVPARSTR